jgi:glucuronate isomerase
LFPADAAVRALARRLYETVRDLPIVSPHGHTDPQWFADNASFPNPSTLLIVPDHYVFRMLYSQGVALESLGIPRVDGGAVETDPRRIWRLFAQHYHLFRGTPTRMWFDHALYTVFGVRERLDAGNADRIYDRLDAALRTPEFRPRALFERFNIEVIATTESPLDGLVQHRKIRDSGWRGRVLTAYRPDPVVDPEYDGFSRNVLRLAELAGEDTRTWRGYLAAHRKRRAFFKSMGATSTDHGHPTARTADLSAAECERLLQRALKAAPRRRRPSSFARRCSPRWPP